MRAAGPPLRWHEPVLAGLLYTVITLVSYAGSLEALGEQLIGDGGDGFETLWDVWWVERSVFQGRNPYFTKMVFAPDGTHLAWHSLALLQSLCIGLLHLRFDVVLAHNLLTMAAFPLAGLAGFSLCRYVTRDTAGSLVGGLAFMLCPFVASKTLGHMDLLFGALLPFFVASLWAATEPAGPRPGSRLALAVVSLALVLSDMKITIFAANVAFWTGLWRARRAERPWAAARQMARAVAPAILTTMPWAATIAYYAIRFEWVPPIERSARYGPEWVSYLLPFTETSRWSDAARALYGGHWMLGQLELAVYLGILVFPLSVLGLTLRRHDPRVRLAGILLAIHLVLSLGPVLLHDRQPVEIAGAAIPLPFAVWRYVPVLGAVSQSGRYMLVGYAMMAIGMASLVVALRGRFGSRRVRAWALALGAAVWLDYLFDPTRVPMPDVPVLSGHGPVLAPYLGNSRMMYFQTHHERPQIGGYLSRVPPFALERYRRAPGIEWFFQPLPMPPIDRASLVEGLQAAGVEEILLTPGDPRARMLARHGFRRVWEGDHAVVWGLPAP